MIYLGVVTIGEAGLLNVPASETNKKAPEDAWWKGGSWLS